MSFKISDVSALKTQGYTNLGDLSVCHIQHGGWWTPDNYAETRKCT
jgi:hypothetical protein